MLTLLYHVCVQVQAQLERTDQLLGYIGRTLRLLEMDQRVNLVVTSDHGMAPVPIDHVINLDSVLDPDWYRALGPDPVLRIAPRPGQYLTPDSADPDWYRALGPASVTPQQSPRHLAAVRLYSVS